MGPGEFSVGHDADDRHADPGLGGGDVVLRRARDRRGVNPDGDRAASELLDHGLGWFPVLAQGVDEDERTRTGAQHLQEGHPRSQMSAPHRVSWVGIVRTRADSTEGVTGDDQTRSRDISH